MSLVCLQRLFSIFLLDYSIRPRLRVRQLHLFAENLKALQHLYCLGRLLLGLEDDEGLTLGFDVLLCDDIEDSTDIAECVAKLLNELRDFSALI